MSRFTKTTVAVLVLTSILGGVPGGILGGMSGTVAMAASESVTPRIFLSFDAQRAQPTRDPIAPRTPFRFYVLAEGTGALGAWEAAVKLPENVAVMERTLAQPRALDIAAEGDEWIVGTGGCLSFHGKAPLLLATYEAMLMEPAAPGERIEIGAPTLSSLGGSQPAWADCSDRSSPRMPVRAFETLDGALILAPGSAGDVVDVRAATDGSSLLGNDPNPFNPSTRIRLRLGTPGDVRVRIFDLAGRLVRTIQLASLQPGEHEVVWHGRDDRGEVVASGSYVVRLESPDGTDVRRIALLK